MATYAIIKDNKVENVIVVDLPESIEALPTFFPDADAIIEQTEETKDAFIGGDIVNGMFRPPAPSLTWVWNTETYLWEPPIKAPEGVFASWDEETQSWIEFPNPTKSI